MQSLPLLDGKSSVAEDNYRLLMDRSLECPICSETFDTKKRRPKMLDCGHTICLADLVKIKKANPGLACPFDNRPCKKNPETLPDNHSLLSLLDAAEIRCRQHDTIAFRFCIGHLEAICPKCDHSQACEVKVLPMDWAEVNHALVDQVACRFEQVRECADEAIEALVKRRFHNLLRDNLALLETLRRLLDQFEGLACQVCGRPASSLVLSTLHAYCLGHATGGLGDGQFVLKGKSAAEICVEIQRVLLQVLKRVDSYKLTAEQLALLTSPPRDAKQLQELGKSILELVAYRKGTYEDCPLVFFCPLCRNSLRKGSGKVFLMPCFDAFHAICPECVRPLLDSESVTCPLDKSVYFQGGKSLKALPELKPFPPRQDSLPLFPAKCALPAQSPAEPVFAPAVFPALPFKLPSQSVGTPLPPLDLPFDSLVLTRFPSVFPPVDVAPESWQPTQRPWRQSSRENQVEAVTFMCTEPVSLLGLALAVPIDRKQVAVLDWVRIYKGTEAVGSVYTEVAAGKRLSGGPHVLSAVLFLSAYPIQPYEHYSLKLKFVGDPPRDYDTYRGNPYDKPDIWLGPDGAIWEFEECLVVEGGECLNGQNNLSGPILQFLYTR